MYLGPPAPPKMQVEVKPPAVLRVVSKTCKDRVVASTTTPLLEGT